jgi:SpoVK/Ycf46/Vps4 family AAA+-type ATPase
VSRHGHWPEKPEEEFIEVAQGHAVDPTSLMNTTNKKTIGRDMSDEHNNDNAQMWAVAGENYFPCEKTDKTLPPAQYLVRYCDSRGYFFSKKSINIDQLIDLPDNNSEEVIASIEKFWDREEFFRQYGFLWKRGIMLHGPPGSGKTSTVQQLSKKIIERGGISIYCTFPRHDAEGLRILRKIEPDRPIVVIIEDIDAIIKHHGESELLAMLDGELQVDNVVFIATTNYPERLDKRLVNRPSRFDEVTYIGMPNAKCREVFLKSKNSRLAEAENAEELQTWVEESEGFSVAHLKELIVSVECLGNSLHDSLDRLKSMGAKQPSSSNATGNFGFSKNVSPTIDEVTESAEHKNK